MTNEQLNKKHASFVESNTNINVSPFERSYMAFLDSAKTVREAVDAVRSIAKTRNFTSYSLGKTELHPGDFVYFINKDKDIVLAKIGTGDVNNGMKLIVSHIDSPHLDLKPNALYEDTELALLKTHYYGGIKKYQWTGIPLSVHGVVTKRDGGKVMLDGNDFVVYIPDLPPHLSRKQMEREAEDIIEAEELNAIIGSMSSIFTDDEKDGFVKNVLNGLNAMYGISAEDLLTAELELVPKQNAMTIGIDHSLIGAYGHDDKSCAYAALEALIDEKNTKDTCIVVLTDKEEIGSDGNTGIQSAYLKYFLEDIVTQLGGNIPLALSNSVCISADVNTAYDPTFSDVFDKTNASSLNRGVVVIKYTGSGGKYGASDASTELMAGLVKAFNEDGVQWQTAEIGKVDLGGGGTVARYLARMNMDVIDVGLPVMSMHAPFEIIAASDLYQTYRGYKAFFEKFENLR